LLKSNAKEGGMKKMSGILLGLFLLGATLSGCAIGSGGRTEINKPTLGQELIELKKAKDAGAISEQEYEEMKENLKKSYE
jgi:hypothetical protein